MNVYLEMQKEWLFLLLYFMYEYTLRALLGFCYGDDGDERGFLDLNLS